MNLRHQDFTTFALEGMKESDLRSLLRMIDSACLEERRHWDGIKTIIKEILE